MSGIEIIAIGREVLDGRVIDTNAVAIAERLKRAGQVPRFAQRVDDDIARIVMAFQTAQTRSSIVIVTGGLGPTSDDLTAEAAARFIGKPQVLDAAALENVEQVFRARGRTMSDVQKKQAYLPEGSTALTNTKGTAPGFRFKHSGADWFFLPGVPLEMLAMFESEVLPHIPVQTGARSYTWYTQFTSEGRLQEALGPITSSMPKSFEITYRTRFPENHVGLHALVTNANEASIFERLRNDIATTLGKDVFFEAPDAAPKGGELEVVVTKLCTDRQILIATAESCTGGLVAHRITQVPGSSRVFWGAMVVYHNLAKQQALGVQAATLETHGAVSEATAREMAMGALERMRASTPSAKHWFAVATTGIAGPDGGTANKPVGLCHLAIARASGVSGTPQVDLLMVQAASWLDRERTKLYFSQKALELIRTHALELT